MSIKELIKANKIEVVNLENATADEMKEIIVALEHNHSVTSFGIARTKLSNDVFKKLINALRNLPNLTYLRLEDMQIDDKRGNELATSLIQFPKLQVINLLTNKINKSTIPILKNLTLKEQIIEINLGNNKIKDNTFVAITPYLIVDRKLQKINFSVNILTDVSGEMLSQIIQFNSQLKAILVSGNKFTEATQNTLITAFNQNTSLVSFDVYGMGLDESKFEKLILRNIEIGQSNRIKDGATIIGDRLKLLTHMTREELDEMYSQQGFIPDFSNENTNDGKIKLLFNKGNFGKLRMGLLDFNNDKLKKFVAIKKVGKKNIQAGTYEKNIHGELTGKNNIIPLYFATMSKDSKNNEVLYLAMKIANFGNGKDFLKKLASKTSQSKEILLFHVFKGMITGVKNMHEAHIFHCDLKPENILLDISDAWISDFGLSRKVLNHKAKLISGDVKYMAPEFVHNFKFHFNKIPMQKLDELDLEKNDAWALGVTLFEMATGKHPYHDGSDINQAINNWGIEFYNEKFANLPQFLHIKEGSIWELIRGLLNVNPIDRLTVKKALEHSYFKNPNSIYKISKDDFEVLMSTLKTVEEKSSKAEIPINQNEKNTYLDVAFESKPEKDNYLMAPGAMGIFSPKQEDASEKKEEKNSGYLLKPTDG